MAANRSAAKSRPLLWFGHVRPQRMYSCLEVHCCMSPPAADDGLQYRTRSWSPVAFEWPILAVLADVMTCGIHPLYESRVLFGLNRGLHASLHVLRSVSWISRL